MVKYTTELPLQVAGETWLQRLRRERPEQLQRAVIQNLVNYVAYAIYDLYEETEIQACAPLRKPLSKELEAVPVQAAQPLTGQAVANVKAIPVAGQLFLDLKDYLERRVQPPPQPQSATTAQPQNLPYLSVRREPFNLEPGQELATQEALERYRSEDWTCSLWLQLQPALTAAQGNFAVGLLGKRGLGEHLGLVVQSQTRQLYLYNNGGWTQKAATIGQWTHLAVVRTSTSMKLYMDGEEVRDSQRAQPAWQAAALVTDVQSWPNISGCAKMADVRFYASALAPQELQAIRSEAKISGSTFEYVGKANEPPKKAAPSKAAPSKGGSGDQEAQILDLLETIVFDLEANHPDAAADLAQKLHDHGLEAAVDFYFPNFVPGGLPAAAWAPGPPSPEAAASDPLAQVTQELMQLAATVGQNRDAPMPQVTSVDELLDRIKTTQHQINAVQELLRDQKPNVAAQLHRTLGRALADQVARADRSTAFVRMELQTLSAIAIDLDRINETMQKYQGVLRGAPGTETPRPP